ncbi:hypothetical protein NDU88_000506 [Pleurodeles waltl]|uniref:Calcium-binding tyrosine phosphorylation-regulated protein n=1 Tax=Pleurodeles waltl TaxID=8319 RepID=A0AAV7USH1_PLEWA|nr:hypothetical protein NDU88_000506 [Pleurodeles waltl]
MEPPRRWPDKRLPDPRDPGGLQTSSSSRHGGGHARRRGEGQEEAAADNSGMLETATTGRAEGPQSAWYIHCGAATPKMVSAAKMMSAKPRLVVPYGLKTLLEGLSRAVLRIQPNSIAQFASTYFTELLHYRECHPALDIKDLVKDFQHQRGMMPKSDDPSNLWTLYRLTDLSQQKGGSSWDPRMQPMMQPMQRPQYMDQRMVNSPAYMISDDQKRRMAAPPYILVGSNVQEAHDWKAIPGHAVLSKNDLNPQRRYAAIPVPVAMNPDGCNQRMVSPNASPGHDMNAPGNPMYYSVAVPMDESQRMAAAQSYAHVGQEQRPPMTSYVNTPTLAVASAASRRPSASAVCDPRTARQGMFIQSQFVIAIATAASRQPSLVDICEQRRISNAYCCFLHMQ